MGGNGSHSSGSGTGRDFPQFFRGIGTGRYYFVGVGRERFENSLPCHPLVYSILYSSANFGFEPGSIASKDKFVSLPSTAYTIEMNASFFILNVNQTLVAGVTVNSVCQQAR